MRRTLTVSKLICFAATITTAGLLFCSTANAFWGNHCGGAVCQPAADCGSCSTAPPACGTCGPAGNGHVHNCIDYLETGRMTNAMWPYPYICPDRVRAHAPFDQMVDNGWRRQCLLGAHHFDNESGKLTRAGELKVQWILTQTPASRRHIYVERSMKAEVTDERIAQAQAFADGLQIAGESVVVEDTHILSPRRPASMVDSERNSFIESRLPAVLPTGTTSTTSASN